MKLLLPFMAVALFAADGDNVPENIQTDYWRAQAQLQAAQNRVTKIQLDAYGFCQSKGKELANSPSGDLICVVKPAAPKAEKAPATKPTDQPKQ